MLYAFLIFILLWAIFVNYVTVFNIAKKKGHEETKVKWLSLIPILGNLYVKKLPLLKEDITQEEFDYLVSFPMMMKRIGLVGLLLLGAILVLAPITIILYLSMINNFMATLSIIFVLLVLLLLHQGLVVEFAKKKGHEGIKAGLIGLIPIYGLIHYHLLPSKRNVSKRALANTFSLKNITGKLLIYAEITLLAVIVLIPIVYIFGMAFSNLRSDVPNQIWPSNPSWGAFEFLFDSEQTKFGRWYLNTITIAFINMIVGTIIITGAAYVFARFSFKGKKAGLLTILVLQAFPSFMGLLAMYVLFWRFGLLGQPSWLSILYIGGSIPGNLWLIKGFLSQIPKDLDESAEIDGASKLKIFIHIILPLAIPILTFVAVSMFMAPWMDYMLPGYLLNFLPENAPAGYDVQQQWTLAVGIFNYINDINNLNYSAFAAASLIVGVPIAVLYLIFQKYLIEGIMAGATKG